MPPRGSEMVAVSLLLVLQAGLLGYSATRHSPTNLEPAFLVSGISHWRFGRFDAYRVNPPLPRMVAAIPVLTIGYKEDWSDYRDLPGSRTEYPLGAAFIRANGANTIPLIVYGRWACIPFSLIGAFFAYRWARDLYGCRAGFLTLSLFVFEPSLLAHGELVTPDGAATSFGIAAGYAFWRWLKQPSWSRAAFAGIALGLAELSKFSWIMLFALWPLLWITWRLLESSARRFHSAFDGGGDTQHLHSTPACTRSGLGCLGQSSIPSCSQLVVILLLGTYVINCGYGFDGCGAQLKQFTFVSQMLTGASISGSPGNRFHDTWLGELPVPFPKQFVLGIDTQKKDFEDYGIPCYLRGEWRKHGGWWYYYAYGLLVKMTCGTLGMLLIVLTVRIAGQRHPVLLRDELVLLLPASALFVVASSQTELNLHLRYVFPSLGLTLIFVGQAGQWINRRQTILAMVTVGLMLENVVSVISVYPHHLAYFNSFAGGPRNGYRHLLGSSLDWGQDLLYLRSYIQTTGEIVDDVRGSYIHPDLLRTTIPNFASKSAAGAHIVVVSPNCMQTGGKFPPEGRMLTPTLWIEEPEPAGPVLGE